MNVRKAIILVSCCDECPHLEGGTMSSIVCSLTGKTFVNSNGKILIDPTSIPEFCPLEYVVPPYSEVVKVLGAATARTLEKYD